MNTTKYSRLDPGQRRDQILDAANALFAQRPYDAVSIEDIARAAGVTRGSCTTTSADARTSTRAATTARRPARGPAAPARRPQRPRARGRQRLALAGLDRNQPHRLPGHDRARRGHRRPRVRRVVADLVQRAVALLAAFHADIAEDPAAALRAGVLDRAQPRRHPTLATRDRPPARPRTSCSPPHWNTSCAPTAPHPHHAGAHPRLELRTSADPGPRRTRTRFRRG